MRRTRVLLADDEDNLRSLLEAAFRHQGFEVVSVSNGRDALDAATTTRPDLIVLDVMMPQIGGFEVCRRLREDGMNTPVLFLSADSTPESRATGLAIGDDYLVKPFGLDELVTRASTLMGQAATHPSPTGARPSGPVDEQPPGARTFTVRATPAGTGSAPAGDAPPAAPPMPPEMDLHRPTSATRPSPTRRRTVSVLVPVMTVVASFGAGLLGGSLATTESGNATTSATGATQEVRTTETSDVSSILSRLTSSVVSIETTVETRRGPFAVQGEGAGTGVVIDDDGHILTNAHVLEGSSSVTVTLHGRTRNAEVLASDEGADIAVLHVRDSGDLVPAGVSTAVELGETVLAIGNALALEGELTVTQGIVSAVGRTIDTSGGTLASLIQTDAAISSGNSGGPLVNADGNVIGINTAVATSDGSTYASNIGFAISIDQALSVVDDLLEP